MVRIRLGLYQSITACDKLFSPSCGLSAFCSGDLPALLFFLVLGLVLVLILVLVLVLVVVLLVTLLHALRPFLKPERRDKVERAAQLARLIHLAKTFLLSQEG